MLDYFHWQEQDAYRKFESYKKMCLESYGENYVYVQPGNYWFSQWVVFSIDGEKLLPGIYGILPHRRELMR